MKGIAILSVIILLGIVAASSIAGVFISKSLNPADVKKDYVNGTLQGNLTNQMPIEKFDFISWLLSVPLFDAIMNVLQGFWLLTSWFVRPLSAFMCTIIMIFNPTAACFPFLGWIILIPFAISMLWSLGGNAHDTFMKLVIILAIVFVVGIVLMLLGAVKI